MTRILKKYISDQNKEEFFGQTTFKGWFSLPDQIITPSPAPSLDNWMGFWLISKFIYFSMHYDFKYTVLWNGKILLQELFMETA